VNYLYGLGIQAIGQIHCGNVFYKEDCYLLGGYENVFLGYKTSMYSRIAAEGLLSHIDLIMFGKLFFVSNGAYFIMIIYNSFLCHCCLLIINADNTQ